MSSGNRVKTREDLLYLLSQAAELEHSLACQYLFTAFSLKDSVDEGITSEQNDKINGRNGWRETINEIAVQEMLHLALVSNLLTAIGGAPYFRRANFPQAKTYSSIGLVFELSPFSAATISRYICFELPNNFQDPVKRERWNQFCQTVRAGEGMMRFLALQAPLLPRKFDYKTIGELYGLIRQGFEDIGDKLFIGPPDAQASGIFRNMKQVTDVNSAVEVIELIVIQGEGSPADREDSHFAKFVDIYEDYLAEREKDPDFQPARPVIDNPLLNLHQDNTVPGANIITNSLSRDVVEIFVALYEVMLQILLRFFAHTNESEEQMYILKSAFINLMPFGISPLAKAITQLPVGDNHPNLNAGPSFEVYADVQLLPQLSSSWIFFQERLQEIAAACDEVTEDSRSQSYPKLRQALGKVSIALKNIDHTISLEPNGGTWTNGISQLFSPMDIAHMKAIRRGRPIDLDNYGEVKDRIGEVQRVVDSNFMPFLPEGPWTQERKDTLQKWQDNNCPE